MSAEILILSDYTEQAQAQQSANTRATTRAFMKHVDMNLININAFGAEYIAHIADWVYKTIWSWGDVCTNIDYILRIEYHVQSCSLHQCMELLEKLDDYLSTPTIATSLEKPFITHTRNKVFERAEFLRSQSLRVIRSN